MKVDIISDIHLDHFRDDGGDFVHTWIPEGEILVLAGDVGDFPWWRERLQYLQVLAEKYEHVLYVAGNHDYYGTSFEKGDARFREIEQQIENFHFLEQDVLEIDGVRFAGCTLWFKEDPSGWIYEKWMSDFSEIQLFKHHVYRRNRESIEFLRSLQNMIGVDVVITHHQFSALSVSKEYINNVHNRFFLCAIDDVILSLQPKFAIHGHTHVPCSYDLGSTKVVCNPKGYPRENPGPYGPVTIEL